MSVFAKNHNDLKHCGNQRNPQGKNTLEKPRADLKGDQQGVFLARTLVHSGKMITILLGELY